MRYALLVLLTATICAAQTDIPAKKPIAELKCGEYERVSHIPAHCANTCDHGTCTANCLYVPEETSCVVDMHLVTEREWQALMARLHALESKQKEQ